MRNWNKQSHVTWYCLYHVVFIPRYRKKAIFGRLRAEIGKIFRDLYCVSTVGLDESLVREYIRNQERNDRIEDQYPLPME